MAPPSSNRSCTAAVGLRAMGWGPHDAHSKIKSFLTYARRERLKNLGLKENAYSKIAGKLDRAFAPNLTSVVSMAKQQHQGNKKGMLLGYFWSEMI